jgi:hypothetical protein
MKQDRIRIRIDLPSEYETIGQLMFDVSAQLVGFPKPDEQPGSGFWLLFWMPGVIFLMIQVFYL